MAILKILFYIILFLIPSNLAKHWPQDWSMVNGILVDYYIPTLYLTDILIGVLLIIWLLELIKNKNVIADFPDFIEDARQSRHSLRSSQRSSRRELPPALKLRRPGKFAITIFFLITLYSLLITQSLANFPVFIYKLIKLIEFGLFALYIKYNINIKKDIKNVINILSLSVIWQSILAVCQWIYQRSIFGYWFFGEQPYTSASLGIKLINFFGALKIPAYGTFPHPNVLAGFLSLSLIFLLFNRGRDRFIEILRFAALGLGIVALFFTFSLAAWLVFLLTGSFILFKKRKIRLISLISLIGLIFLVDPVSLQRRIVLNKIAAKMWLSSPLLGVGLGNFIARMEEFGQVVSNIRFLQPVHNIYLLVLAETGIIGIIGFIGLIRFIDKNLWKKKHYCLLITVYSLLFLGFFDHFFLTIQQGMLMLSFIFGLAGAASSTPTSSSTAAGKTAGRPSSGSAIRRRKS